MEKCRIQNLLFLWSCFLLLTIFSSNADQFDKNKNNVCFTSEDCHPAFTAQIESNQAGESQTDLPLFCHNKFECLCNRQQLHSHTSSEMVDLLNKCVKCNNIEMNDEVDPCMAQDPYSFCNQTSGLCDCSLTRDDLSGTNTNNKRLLNENELSQTLLFARSVCLHTHINQHFDSIQVNNESLVTETDNIQKKQHYSVYTVATPLSEWLLTILLAYVLPVTVIFIFVYFIYRQGCFCGKRDDTDSEMILYRQL